MSQRPLKFRFWDKVCEEYLDLGNSTFELPFMDFKGRLWKIVGDFDTRVDVTDQFILEQYTGLKDKHGKEIFEGDVVSGGESNEVITWSNEYSGFCIGGDSYGWMVDEGQTYKVEVIGTIHTDPELLGDEET